ncbi:RHS domain-containing protein [Enterobacteriaceae bacterium BIT-l23]|nr:RHS domain-containing protein [Enterobacteriaceae bacterium BIT-l23]
MSLNYSGSAALYCARQSDSAPSRPVSAAVGCIVKTITTRCGTVETRFLWEGWRLLQSREGERCATYLYDPNETWSPLARVDHPAQAQDGECYWFTADLNGAPLEVTDADGAVRWSGQYGSFGEVSHQTAESWALRQGKPTINQPLRYAGQYADSETGLHYNLFRYYDPGVGRFTTQDPIGLNGGLNLYQYAPNPLGWVDPLGLAADDLVRYKPAPTLSAEPGARATAISRAWGEERELVAAGGGSREWNAAEREVILSTKNNRQLSSVMSEMGYTGHHINSVKGNGALGGKWQGDPRNIVFLQNANHPSGYDEHLNGNQGHRGSYENPGRGRLIDRSRTRKNLISCP